jgi:hypothetical protein
MASSADELAPLQYIIKHVIDKIITAFSEFSYGCVDRLASELSCLELSMDTRCEYTQVAAVTLQYTHRDRVAGH